MARNLKVLNLLNQNYEFDATKLGGITPSGFVQTNNTTIQEMNIKGWFIEFGSKIEMTGYGQHSKINLKNNTNAIQIDNEYINLIGNVTVNGTPHGSGGSALNFEYVCSGTFGNDADTGTNYLVTVPSNALSCSTSRKSVRWHSN